MMLDLRAQIASEVPRQIHVRGAPQDRRDRNYGHGLGMPFAPGFKRYIGHPDGWGKTRLGTQSILEVDAWCRQRHAGHDRGEKRPVCAKLLFDVCYWGQDPTPELEPLLSAALRHALAWRIGTSRPRLDEPLANLPLPRPANRGKVSRDGHRRAADKGIRAEITGRVRTPQNRLRP